MRYLIIVLLVSYISLSNAETLGQYSGHELPRFVSTKFNFSPHDGHDDLTEVHRQNIQPCNFKHFF